MDFRSGAGSIPLKHYGRERVDMAEQERERSMISRSFVTLTFPRDAGKIIEASRKECEDENE